MQNAGLDEAQAGIKISRRNISNLRYADNNTLMAESEEELKSLETKVKESESEFAQSCLTLCNPMDCAYQAPRSMGFSRQEYWSELSFASPGEALTRRTLVGKVISLLLNILSRLLITFLPRSKRLLILWLQSPSAVRSPPK